MNFATLNITANGLDAILVTIFLLRGFTAILNDIFRFITFIEHKIKE